MAMKTKCLTAGAHFTTVIEGSVVHVRVTMPGPMHLTTDEAKTLEALLHNGVELALAPFWNRIQGQRHDPYIDTPDNPYHLPHLQSPTLGIELLDSIMENIADLAIPSDMSDEEATPQIMQRMLQGYPRRLFDQHIQYYYNVSEEELNCDGYEYMCIITDIIANREEKMAVRD